MIMNVGAAAIKPGSNIVYASSIPSAPDQIVTAFDNGPNLISPAAGNIPSVEQTLAAFLPGNGIFSPNQFTTDSNVTLTVPTVAKSAAPAAATTETHIPYLLFIAAGAALYLMKKRKHI